MSISLSSVLALMPLIGICAISRTLSRYENTLQDIIIYFLLISFLYVIYFGWRLKTHFIFICNSLEGGCTFLQNFMHFILIAICVIYKLSYGTKLCQSKFTCDNRNFQQKNATLDCAPARSQLNVLNYMMFPFKQISKLTTNI